MGDVIDINGTDSTDDGRGPKKPGKCNVWIPKREKRCERGAGEGTDHLGHGPCSNHLGNTPVMRQKAHKEAAVEYTRTIASELDINPVDALLWAVRLSAGSVAYWVEQMNRLETGGTDPALAVAVEDAYGRERDRLAKTSALCIQVGLAERQVRLAERQGDLMAQILEATLEHMGMKPEKIETAKRYAAKVALALPAGGTF